MWIYRGRTVVLVRLPYERPDAVVSLLGSTTPRRSPAAPSARNGATRLRSSGLTRPRRASVPASAEPAEGRHDV